MTIEQQCRTVSKILNKIMSESCTTITSSTCSTQVAFLLIFSTRVAFLLIFTVSFKISNKKKNRCFGWERVTLTLYSFAKTKLWLLVVYCLSGVVFHQISQNYKNFQKGFLVQKQKNLFKNFWKFHTFSCKRACISKVFSEFLFFDPKKVLNLFIFTNHFEEMLVL